MSGRSAHGGLFARQFARPQPSQPGEEHRCGHANQHASVSVHSRVGVMLLGVVSLISASANSASLVRSPSSYTLTDGSKLSATIGTSATDFGVVTELKVSLECMVCMNTALCEHGTGQGSSMPSRVCAWQCWHAQHCTNDACTSTVFPSSWLTYITGGARDGHCRILLQVGLIISLHQAAARLVAKRRNGAACMHAARAGAWGSARV